MKLLCDCNDPYKLFSNEHQSSHMFDSWSFFHTNLAILLFFLFNLIFLVLDKNKNIVNVSLICSIIVIIICEIVENSDTFIAYAAKKNKNKKYGNYTGDILINSFGDILSAFVGLFIAHSFIKHGTNNVYIFIKKNILFILTSFIILETIPYYLSGETSIKAFILGEWKLL
jgi:hypothetical protein